jgi:hypothetical protein
MVIMSWLIFCSTNHGLKDNQDEGDFSQGAALFFPLLMKRPFPVSWERVFRLKTESLRGRSLRRTDVGGQAFGSVVVQIHKQTV